MLSAYLCRLVNHMDRAGYDVVTPRGGGAFISPDPFVEMTSGYVKRGVGPFSKQATGGPWRTTNNVLVDTFKFRFAPLEDSHLDMGRGHQGGRRSRAPVELRKTA